MTAKNLKKQIQDFLRYPYSSLLSVVYAYSFINVVNIAFTGYAVLSAVLSGLVLLTLPLIYISTLKFHSNLFKLFTQKSKKVSKKGVLSRIKSTFKNVKFLMMCVVDMSIKVMFFSTLMGISSLPMMAMLTLLFYPSSYYNATKINKNGLYLFTKEKFLNVFNFIKSFTYSNMVSWTVKELVSLIELKGMDNKYSVTGVALSLVSFAMLIPNSIPVVIGAASFLLGGVFLVSVFKKAITEPSADIMGVVAEQVLKKTSLSKEDAKKIIDVAKKYPHSGLEKTKKNIIEAIAEISSTQPTKAQPLKAQPTNNSSSLADRIFKRHLKDFVEKLNGKVSSERIINFLKKMLGENVVLHPLFAINSRAISLEIMGKSRDKKRLSKLVENQRHKNEMLLRSKASKLYNDHKKLLMGAAVGVVPLLVHHTITFSVNKLVIISAIPLFYTYYLFTANRDKVTQVVHALPSLLEVVKKPLASQNSHVVVVINAVKSMKDFDFTIDSPFESVNNSEFLKLMLMFIYSLLMINMVDEYRDLDTNIALKWLFCAAFSVVVTNPCILNERFQSETIKLISYTKDKIKHLKSVDLSVSMSSVPVLSRYIQDNASNLVSQATTRKSMCQRLLKSNPSDSIDSETSPSRREGLCDRVRNWFSAS